MLSPRLIDVGGDVGLSRIRPGRGQEEASEYCKVSMYAEPEDHLAVRKKDKCQQERPGQLDCTGCFGLCVHRYVVDIGVVEEYPDARVRIHTSTYVSTRPVHLTL